MANTTYQCVVNRLHTKRVNSMLAPYCCGRTMIKVRGALAAESHQTISTGQQTTQESAQLIPDAYKQKELDPVAPNTATQQPSQQLYRVN